MSYPNGQWPLNLFIEIGRGTDNHGLYLHLAPPGTAARWAELVRLAREKYGVTLRITPGYNVYRPLEWQTVYRAELGIRAAVPGTSSHGMVYNGRPCCAIDVNNWGSLAPGNGNLAWARFVALCRIVGFTVDFVKPQELWHIGDFDPLTVPAFAAISVNPFTTNKPADEENELNETQSAQLAALFNDRAASGGIQYYERVSKDHPVTEWMIVDPTLPPLESDPMQDGYRVTEDFLGEAVTWGWQVSGIDTVPVHLNADDYVKAQTHARWRAQTYRAGQVALIREALAGFLPPKA